MRYFNQALYDRESIFEIKVSSNKVKVSDAKTGEELQAEVVPNFRNDGEPFICYVFLKMKALELRTIDLDIGTSGATILKEERLDCS